MAAEEMAAALPKSLRLNGRLLEGESAFRAALEGATDAERPVLEFCLRWCDPAPDLTIHTSGSTGTPKPIRVLKTCMVASARMTVKRLGLEAGDEALLCLPMDYIAGQMMVVRAMEAGLDLVAVPPSRHPLAGRDHAPVFLAVVPLQAKAMLEDSKERELFEATREVIIGGAAVDADLAIPLKAFPHRVWSTYGMTETLSHVALRPLSGDRAGVWYEPLEGVRVWASDRGTLSISAPAVGAPSIETNDMVAFDAEKRRFRILGRTDNVIDSGGIKVCSEALEAVIAEALSVPFCIAPLPDAELGLSVAIALEGRAGDVELPDFRALLKAAGLSPYWKPRTAVYLPEIPRTRSGKLDRGAVKSAVLRSAPGSRVRIP